MVKKQKNYFYILLVAVPLLLLCAAIFPTGKRSAEAATGKPTATPKPEKRKVSSITAVYTGKTELVGHAIDLEKIKVMALFTDGSYEEVKDYSLSDTVIERAGKNEILVTYESASTIMSVDGKNILALLAYSKVGTKTVGEQLKKSEIVVRVNYSDGSGEEVSDYTLDDNIVRAVGSNNFEVTYEGLTTKFVVMGKAMKIAKQLQAFYNGPSVIVGNTPKRSDFAVTVVYNDNSLEVVTDFELSPSVVQKEGENKFIVSRGDLTAEAKVNGISKEVVSITAEYKGFPLVIGTSVSNDDVKVTATFNDESKDTVKNFTISNPVVYQIGENIIKVTCGEASTSINVRGVEAELINYDYGVERTLQDGILSVDVKVAMNPKADSTRVSLRTISTSLVKKAMRRIINTDKYMAVEIDFDDPELAIYLPMTVKVTVPAGFEKESFGVFYSPNRKTIMAQMNGSFLKDGTYEFKMFQPGTYILADCIKRIYVEEIVIDEDEISLKKGKSHSLRPVVYPFDATDKTLLYSSSRPSVATVNEDGLITAVSEGSTMITVEAGDGSGEKISVYVRVKNK